LQSQLKGHPLEQLVTRARAQGLVEEGVELLQLTWVDLCNVPRASLVPLRVQEILDQETEDEQALSMLATYTLDIPKGIHGLAPVHLGAFSGPSNVGGNNAMYEAPRINPVGKIKLRPLLRSVCMRSVTQPDHNFDHPRQRMSGQQRNIERSVPVLVKLTNADGSPWDLCPVTFLQKQVRIRRDSHMHCSPDQALYIYASYTSSYQLVPLSCTQVLKFVEALDEMELRTHQRPLKLQFHSKDGYHCLEIKLHWEVFCYSSVRVGTRVLSDQEQGLGFRDCRYYLLLHVRTYTRYGAIFWKYCVMSVVKNFSRDLQKADLTG
jgi:hypothetical protein